MKFTVLFILTALMTAGISAGPVENLEKEFSQVEEFHKNDKPSDADKKRLLEKNILSAVKITLMKRYEDSSSLTKDLTADKLDYQYFPESYICYVRYNNFYLFYKFYKDAQAYHQSPVMEKFYFKPANMTTETHEPAKAK